MTRVGVTRVTWVKREKPSRILEQMPRGRGVELSFMCILPWIAGGAKPNDVLELEAHGNKVIPLPDCCLFDGGGARGTRVAGPNVAHVPVCAWIECRVGLAA